MVLLGDRYDKTEVSFHQFVQRILVSHSNSLRTVHFLLSRQHIYLGDILEIFLYRLGISIGNTLGDFELSHLGLVEYMHKNPQKVSPPIRLDLG